MSKPMPRHNEPILKKSHKITGEMMRIKILNKITHTHKKKIADTIKLASKST